MNTDVTAPDTGVPCGRVITVGRTPVVHRAVLLPLRVPLGVVHGQTSRSPYHFPTDLATQFTIPPQGIGRLTCDLSSAKVMSSRSHRSSRLMGDGASPDVDPVSLLHRQRGDKNLDEISIAA